MHPELDKLAVEAVKQWKYEPVIYEGKTIRAFTFISFIFDPGELPEVEDSVPREPLSEELTAIIDRGWEYCRKMDAIAHFYLCREKISENIKNIVNVGSSIMMSLPGEFFDTYKVSYFVPMLANPDRNRYLNEYQITTRDNRVIELRTPVKPTADERDSLFSKKPLFSPVPISISARLLAPGYRQEFTFSLGEDKIILGRNCRVITIKALKRRGILIKTGTVWIEKNSDRVVKAEVEIDSSTMDERILAECKRYYLTPYMTVSYEYDVENRGILFPSRSEINLEYTGLGQANQRGTKASVDFQYDNYRFFTVDTEQKIIK